MSRERVNASVRFRPKTLRAVDEVAVLLDGLSREAVVHLLLLDGLQAAYARLGIGKDPAAAAGELLAVLAGSWADDLSGAELEAFAVTRTALARMAETRARETGP